LHKTAPGLRIQLPRRCPRNSFCTRSRHSGF